MEHFVDLLRNGNGDKGAESVQTETGVASRKGFGKAYKGNGLGLVQLEGNRKYGDCVGNGGKIEKESERRIEGERIEAKDGERNRIGGRNKGRKEKRED